MSIEKQGSTVGEHKRVAKFYDDVYYKGAEAGASPSLHLKKLSTRLGVSSGWSVLDVACGAGDWLAVVAASGATVSGIDISARAVSICSQRMPNGKFHTGPAEVLPFPDCTYDLVTCLGSLEHFLDQPAALAEMVRVVKPDGKVVILVPNAGFLTYRLGLYKGTQQQAIRETIRPLSEWEQMLNSSGLAVTERWKDLHVLDKQWIFRAPWLLMPLRLLQALALTVWPLNWQYQVYHLCQRIPIDGNGAQDSDANRS